MTLKLDMGSIAQKIKTTFKDNPRLASRVGVGNDLKKMGEGDFLPMPEWWSDPDSTNTPGLPKGRITMIAGDSDSGKTSAAIVAMKQAQANGWGIIYVETEDKTTEQDLVTWGVDPSGVLLVKSTIAEEAFELGFQAWDAFRDKYPNVPFLWIFDSLGQTVSLRDADMNLMEDSQKPGGKGSINRLGLSKLISKMHEDQPAVLIINYTYDNIGSPGKTNAGGKAVNFYSALTYQTMRKSWIESEAGGRKKRIGAEVVWKLFKNHVNKTDPGAKEITLRITKEGVQLVKPKTKEERAAASAPGSRFRKSKANPDPTQE